MNRNKVGFYIAILLAVLIALAAMLIAYNKYTIKFGTTLPEYHTQWGEMGDFFGGVLNPTFSFIAIILLIMTLIQNQTELCLTREELEKSSKALIEQSETAKNTKYNSIFFHLYTEAANRINAIRDRDNNLLEGTLEELRKQCLLHRGAPRPSPLFEFPEVDLAIRSFLTTLNFASEVHDLRVMALKSTESRNAQEVLDMHIEVKAFYNLITNLVRDDFITVLAYYCNDCLITNTGHANIEICLKHEFFGPGGNYISSTHRACLPELILKLSSETPSPPSEADKPTDEPTSPPPAQS